MEITKEQKDEYIKRIKTIGMRGFAFDSDFEYFNPFKDTGESKNKFLFSINWANAKDYVDEGVWDFVIGLHLIELRFREMENNDFGIGSPYPTEMIIRAVELRNKEQAQEMRKWVAENGGNYYINNIKDYNEENNDYNQEYEMVEIAPELNKEILFKNTKDETEINEKDNYVIFNLLKTEKKELVEKRLKELAERCDEDIYWAINRVEDILINRAFNGGVFGEETAIMEGYDWLRGGDIEGLTF